MKAKQARPRFEYPKPEQQRSGCKVSWHYYRKYRDALEAARIARTEASFLAGEGYDFGFQVPGAITHYAQGQYAALYEVVIP